MVRSRMHQPTYGRWGEVRTQLCSITRADAPVRDRATQPVMISRTPAHAQNTAATDVTDVRADALADRKNVPADYDGVVASFARSSHFRCGIRERGEKDLVVLVGY